MQHKEELNINQLSLIGTGMLLKNYDLHKLPQILIFYSNRKTSRVLSNFGLYPNVQVPIKGYKIKLII